MTFHTWGMETVENAGEGRPRILVASDASLDEGAIIRTIAEPSPLSSGVEYFLGVERHEAETLGDLIAHNADTYGADFGALGARLARLLGHMSGDQPEPLRPPAHEQSSEPLGFLLTDLESCAPESLPADSSVRWGFTGRREGAGVGVWIWARTRGELFTFLATHWGVVDKSGDFTGDVDWFAETVAAIEPADQPEGAMRTVLVHINATLPDSFKATQLGDEIGAAIGMVRDDDENLVVPALMAATEIGVAFAEEIN